MKLYSSYEQTYLIDQCILNLDWVFKKIAPIGLFWYDSSKLIKSFDFDDHSFLSFLLDEQIEDEKVLISALETLPNQSFSKACHLLGTFVLVGHSDKEELNKALDMFCMRLDWLNMQKPEEAYYPSIKDISTEKLLLHLLHRTDYYKQIDLVLAYFTDFMASALGEPAALYLFDRNKNTFFYNCASDVDLDELLASQKKLSHLKGFEQGDRPAFFSIEEASVLYPHLEPSIKSFRKDSFYYLIPIEGKDIVFALLLLGAKVRLKDQDLDQITQMVNEVAKFLSEIQTYIQFINHGRRYKQLFSVTTKFHSSMDQQEILEEVVHSIVRLYPECSVKLIVTDYGIDPLEKEPVAMEAFLKGELRVTHEASGASTIYAPLKGRQGVYGVFIIKTPINGLYDEDELSFMQLQATTAGHALENAKLYEQSQRSISDLQLINQASERMNSKLRMSETIPYLIEQIKDSFLAEEVGFYELNESKRWEAFQSSTAYFKTMESDEFIERLSYQIKQEGEALFLGDLASEVGWQDARFRSLMAVPMKQDGEILGFVVALHKKPYQFTFDGFKVMQALVHHSTLALINARLREELEWLVITDQLTQLYNRTYLNNKINESFHQDQRGVLLLIDLDNFKQINDQYGHLVGDEVLVQVAHLIKTNTRKDDIAARWGGEELSVYFPNLSVEEAMEIATRIMKKVEGETNPSVTISCGLSAWEKDILETCNNNLFSQADQALYLAKRNGKNRIEILLP